MLWACCLARTSQGKLHMSHKGDCNVSMVPRWCISCVAWPGSSPYNYCGSCTNTVLQQNHVAEDYTWRSDPVHSPGYRRLDTLLIVGNSMRQNISVPRAQHNIRVPSQSSAGPQLPINSHDPRSETQIKCHCPPTCISLTPSSAHQTDITVCPMLSVTCKH